MASSVSQNSIFQCCICLDNFTDPVSIPCGHNFCKACIYSYWDTADIIQCPLCQQTFKRRLQLKVNVLLRDLIELKQTEVQDVPKEENQVQGVLCDVCVGEKKATSVKSCLICEESYCPDHVKPHQEDVKLKTHELLDPVSRLRERVCKHHKSPLEMVCLQDHTCVCVMCIKADHQNHQRVPLQRRLRKKKSQIDQELAELQQEIKDRHKVLMQVEQSGELGEKNIRTDIADVRRIFSQLQTLLKINEAGLLAALTLQHGKAKFHSESIKEKLQEEVSELEIRHGELDHLSQITDDLHLLQSAHSLSEPPVTKDWSEVSAYSDSGVGTVRSGVIRLRNELHSKVTDEMKGLVTKEIKRIQQYAVDVTLDSDTANSLLVVSNDGKQVKNEGILQNLPDNPERFDILLGVLGKEGFSSGAFYFEVQVEGKVAWDIGIALETVDRKGNMVVGLRNGYAALMLRDGKTLKACDQRPIEFVVSHPLKSVGVFVDHEAGEVCFYDVGNNAHIYSFTRCQFPKKKLHPYLNTCSHHEANSAPMVITSAG